MSYSANSPLLSAVSWLAVWSLGSLAVAFVGMLAAVIFHYPFIAAVALPILVLSVLLLLPIRFLFRCPSCGERILVQGSRSLHPARHRLPFGIASWVAVALDIVRHREFTCVHCGARCTVKT